MRDDKFVKLVDQAISYQKQLKLIEATLSDIKEQIKQSMLARKDETVEINDWLVILREIVKTDVLKPEKLFKHPRAFEMFRPSVTAIRAELPRVEYEKYLKERVTGHAVIIQPVRRQ